MESDVDDFEMMTKAYVMFTNKWLCMIISQLLMFGLKKVSFWKTNWKSSKRFFTKQNTVHLMQKQAFQSVEVKFVAQKYTS